MCNSYVMCNNFIDTVLAHYLSILFGNVLNLKLYPSQNLISKKAQIHYVIQHHHNLTTYNPST